MTTKTIETVTDEQLAELEALRQGADYLAYPAFAGVLAPKMAAHLAALKAAEQRHTATIATLATLEGRLRRYEGAGFAGGDVS